MAPRIFFHRRFRYPRVLSSTMSHLPYQDHRFPHNQSSLLECLRCQPQTLRESLDGWLHSRKADIDLQSLRLVELEGDLSGYLTLSFEETQWLACRLETGREPHQVRIPFRIETESVILSTLPRDAFGDRVDEF